MLLFGPDFLHVCRHHPLRHAGVLTVALDIWIQDVLTHTVSSLVLNTIFAFNQSMFLQRVVTDVVRLGPVKRAGTSSFRVGRVVSVATVLLQQYCCNSTVATILLRQYCCNSTDATVLLQQCCNIKSIRRPSWRRAGGSDCLLYTSPSPRD